MYSMCSKASRDPRYLMVLQAVCNLIRSSAQPIFAEYVGSYQIKALEFEKLSLGTLPPAIHGSFLYFNWKATFDHQGVWFLWSHSIVFLNIGNQLGCPKYDQLLLDKPSEALTTSLERKIRQDQHHISLLTLNFLWDRLTLEFVSYAYQMAGVKVHETNENELVLEPAIRWAGNPNIILVLKLLFLRIRVQVRYTFNEYFSSNII